MDTYSMVQTLFTIGFGVCAIYLLIDYKKVRINTKRKRWHLYRDASGIFEGLRRIHSEVCMIHKDLNAGQTVNFDDLTFDLGRITVEAKNLMESQIKQISRHENMSTKKIDRWFHSGKICQPSHREIFKEFASL